MAYRHRIELTNKRIFEFTVDQEEVLPCYTGIKGSLFFYYRITDKDKKELYCFPACQVVSIDTKEIDG